MLSHCTAAECEGRLQLFGKDIDKAVFPPEQFKIIDPLQSLDRSHKILAEILLGYQEAGDNDTGASSAEKKRIRYAWEQLAVFRHNGISFCNLGRVLQFTVVFLALLTTTTAVDAAQCDDLTTDYMDQLDEWQNTNASPLDAPLLRRRR